MEVLQLLVSGLANGCVYGLIALGFVLIYKATEAVNFAQGDFMMLGAFVMIGLVNPQFMGMNFWLAVPLAPLIMAVLGYLFDIVMLRRWTGGVNGMFAPDISLFGLEINRWVTPGIPVLDDARHHARHHARRHADLPQPAALAFGPRLRRGARQRGLGAGDGDRHRAHQDHRLRAFLRHHRAGGRAEQLCFLPLCHVLERLVSLYTPLIVSSTVNFAESPETVFDNLREVSPHGFVAVPRIWEKVYSRVPIMAQEATWLGRRAFAAAVTAGRARAAFTLAGRPVPRGIAARFLLWDLLVLRNLRRMLGMDRLRQGLTGDAPPVGEGVAADGRCRRGRPQSPPTSEPADLGARRLQSPTSEPEILEAAGDQREAALVREAVVGALDQREPQIGALGMLEEPQRDRGRHVGIGRSLQQPHREGQRQRVAQDQVGAAVLDQAAGDDVGLVGIVRGTREPPRRHQLAALLLGEPGPHPVLGEVGRGGDADEPRHPLGPRAGHQERDPAAHRRADEHLRPRGPRVEDSERILGPVADRAIEEVAGTGAVAGIVEPQEGPPACPRPALEEERLGAGHVRPEAAEEDDAGLGAPAPVMGDAPALRRLEMFRFPHVLSTPSAALAGALAGAIAAAGGAVTPSPGGARPGPATGSGGRVPAA